MVHLEMQQVAPQKLIPLQTGLLGLRVNLPGVAAC